MPTREKHEGYITRNDDPEKRGRVCVMCQSIVAGEVLEWVEPSFPFVDSEGQAGWIFIPNVGSVVSVEINAGHESEVTDLQPKWMCDLYPEGTFPEDFEENYPQRRGFVTKAGHVLYFDDTDNQQTMLYRHPSGTEILVTNEGRIELKPTGSQSVYVGENADQPIPLGNLLKTLLANMKTKFDAHTHAVVGATAVAVDILQQFPTVDSTILSANHKVK